MDRWMNRWKDGWTDAWLLWMCGFLSPFCPCLFSLYWLLSISHPLCLAHSLLQTLSHFPFLLSDLLFTSLSDSFSLPLDTWNPSISSRAPGRLDSHQQCFPLRKRNRMMNKRTERTETDKKLWDERLYRYVKVFLHVLYCTGWHFTQSCVNLQKDCVESRNRKYNI